MSIPEKIKEEIRKMGFDPEKIPFVTEITPDLDGEFIAFEGVIEAFAIRLDPPITIVDDVGERVEYKTKYLDHDITIENGLLITDLSGEKGTNKAKQYFNDFISIMNIIGIPLKYVSDYDILFMVKGEENVVQVGLSNIGLVRGKDLKPNKINIIEFDKIMQLINELSRGIKNHDLYGDSEVWRFLGKGTYYGFHADRFNTFLYHWLFLESNLNWIWRNVTDSKFDNAPPSEDERNWTMQIKIDELSMLEIIGKGIRDKLHRLRRKRNSIFHADPNPDKRIITDENIHDSINISRRIFYKNLEFDPARLKDVDKIRMKIYTTIHKPNMIG